MQYTERLFELMENDPVNKILYRNQVVEGNIKLVPHILKKYRPYTDDQYQSGCIGLIIAVDTYDPSRGVPFASYGCFCIEREIHKLHRATQKLVEYVFASNMVYLDSEICMIDGEKSSISSIIPDVIASEAIDDAINELDLAVFFEKIVWPSIDQISNATRNHTTRCDMEVWKDLEARYLIELSRSESQKIRFNLSQMARHLGISVSNVRTKHLRVIHRMRTLCEEVGYHSRL